MRKITKIDFKEKIIDELVRAYHKDISTDQIDLYYDHLKSFDLESLQKAVEDVINNPNIEYFPKIAEIRREAKFAQRETVIKKRKPVYCPHCSGSGWITVQDSNGYETAYRCTCVNGQRLPKENMSYTDAMKKYGLPPLDQPDDPGTPIIPYERILADPGKFYTDIKVEYICKNCGKIYYVPYHDKVMGRWIIECHAEESGGLCLCDFCYEEEGRRRGFWE